MSRRVTRFQDRRGNNELSQKDEEFEGSNLPFTTNFALEPKRLIWIFEECFKYILDLEDLQQQIQIVKGDLYNRDYIGAFNSDDKRYAYVSRWTPPRALAYSSLFSSLPTKDLFEDPDTTTNVLCVGGGASGELVGLASVFCRAKEYNPSTPSSINIDIVDIADWSAITSKLTSYIQSNWIYDPTKFNTNFIKGDILNPNSYKTDLSSLDLITILFTTNELFTEQRQKTVQFLQLLNSTCKSGSYLLIAESAGSFSNITIGTKQFPVQFLIDMILTGKKGEDDGAWEIVAENDSCWYRVNEVEIIYPMKLENMRFFYRLYQKK